MKIVFAAGGTAGHVNPALAVADYIRKNCSDADILFIGTGEKIEAKIVPAAGFKFKTIDITGFQRKLSLENIKRNIGTVVKLARSTGRVKKILKDFNPDIVVGFGGYVSGPVLRTAAKMGIRTATHEQNAFPGMTTKALAKYVDTVMLTAPEAEKYLKCKNPPVVTGLPVRGSLLAADRDVSRMELGLDDRPLVLSFGGSLGAKKINEAVADVMEIHLGQNKYYHIHATGQYGIKWMPKLLKSKGIDLEKEKNITLREYIDDMDRCMSAADLVICRAGASTLSELQAMGKPSILIPSPNVAENHQYHNAMALVRKGAAIIIEEKDLTGELLAEKIEELLSDKNKLLKIGENARKMAILDANKRIADIITGV